MNWLDRQLWNARKMFLINGGNLTQKDLCYIFPDLLSNVRCGVHIPNGWVHLVYDVLLFIQEHNDNGEGGSPIIIEQIKEKFGGLRVYISGGRQRAKKEKVGFLRPPWRDISCIYAILSFAERYSLHICQETGGIKDLGYTKGWFSVVGENYSGGNDYVKQNPFSMLLAKYGDAF